jgi:hypothetical protein
MALITVAKGLPQLINLRRHARNGYQPAAGFYRLLADGSNHLAAYRRKLVFLSPPTWTGFPSASWVSFVDSTSGASRNKWRWRFHAGHAAAFLAIRVGMMKVNAPSGEPYVDVAVTVAGGGTTTSDPISYGTTDGTEIDAADDISWQTVLVPITANTTYECLVVAHNDARPAFGCAYEVAAPPDDSVSGYVARSYTIGSPIFDAHRGALMPTLDNAWRHNAAFQLNWTANLDAQAITRTSATYANLFDQTLTTVTAASPGYTFDLTYRNRLMKTTVPCVFAVNAKVSSGSGGRARLETAGGTVVEITGISTTQQWYTATANVPTGSTKADLQLRSGGADTITLYAMSFYEYET